MMPSNSISLYLGHGGENWEQLFLFGLVLIFFFNAEFSVVWKHSRLFLAPTRVFPAGSVVFLHMGAQNSFPRSLRAQQLPGRERGGGRQQQPHGW